MNLIVSAEAASLPCSIFVAPAVSAKPSTEHRNLLFFRAVPRPSHMCLYAHSRLIDIGTTTASASIAHGNFTS